jgi:hypothetical protein
MSKDLETSPALRRIVGWDGKDPKYVSISANMYYMLLLPVIINTLVNSHMLYLAPTGSQLIASKQAGDEFP